MNWLSIKESLYKIQNWSGIKLRTLSIFISIIILSTILCIIIIIIATKDDYELLYSDLSLEDSANILKELEIRKFKYELSNDSKTIKVPKNNIAQIRIYLSALGLPFRGSIIGYEIFDKEEGISTTNFTQNIRYIRALEGELSRTISAFNKIKRARIHLVIPHRELFSKEKLDTKASIMLTLTHQNQKLNEEEVNSISHLVLTAVPAIEMKNITIVDDSGRSFKVSDNNTFAHTKQNLELKFQYEESIKENIEELLSNILGPSKVKATVNLEICFDKIVTNSEVYDPQNVIRSSQIIEERDQIQDNTFSDLSVANNLSDNQINSGSGSSPILNEKTDKQTNYEISKTIKNHIREPGNIQKMSIGILVDGEYFVNEENQKLEYKPRSEEEINKIINLVTASVGLSKERGDKIEIINMQFIKTDEKTKFDLSSWIIENLIDIVKWTIISLTIIAILVFVKNLLKNIPKIALEKQQSFPNNDINTNSKDDPDDENIEDFSLQATNSNIKDLFNEIVSKNPNKLASFIRDMLSKKINKG
ncbi:MAG: flagellar M-ring protein FliF [Rickettsia sp.]|nr:flagellar M-ring protein FliF [Rickettsia sp.]